MDVASIADVLAKNVPFFADSLGELHLTPSHETEWHQVYFADDGRHKVVVSIPSWSGTDLYSKTLAEEALSGLGPHHIGTLVHGSHILLVNEFFDGGTLKTEDLTSETLAMVGSLYARLHKADVSWFQPVCEKLLADGVLAKHESDWAFCLWVLPRLLGALAADFAAQYYARFFVFVAVIAHVSLAFSPRCQVQQFVLNFQRWFCSDSFGKVSSSLSRKPSVSYPHCCFQNQHPQPPRASRP